MTTVSPTTVSISQKRKLWKQYKFNTFKAMSQDKYLMFNYFLKNNDLFHLIDPQDQIRGRAVDLMYMNKSANAFLGTLAGVFITDQIIMRFLTPNFRIPRFRFLVFLGKYLLMPCIGFTIVKMNFMQQQQTQIFNLTNKYDFSFEDFMNANKIFDRALQVDRLQELVQRRTKFDWTGVPQLPQQK